MIPPNDDAMLTLTRAAERVAEIDNLFRSMRKIMHVWLSDTDDPSPEMPKKWLAKIAEMQTAHQLLLKAEEKYHDLSHDGGSGDPAQDIADIRVEIGGILDRMRTAARENGVSVASD